MNNFWANSNVAEWVGGLGTIAALVFAARSIRADTRSAETARQQTDRSLAFTETALSLQAARDQRDLEDRERRQAAQISCTAHYIFDQEIGIVAANHSSTPIFQVRAFVVAEDGSYWQSAATDFTLAAGHVPTDVSSTA